MLEPSWSDRVPEPVLVGGALFVAMVAASLVVLPIVWFNNWRRLVPEKVHGTDYLKAAFFFIAISFAIAVGSALGIFLLEPLRQIGPGVAAVPGAVIVVVVLMIAGKRRLRGGG
jgi:uncharacterized membrane-anchored protein